MSEPTEEAGIKLDSVSVSKDPGQGWIEFDRKKYNKLRMAYNQALAREKDEFVFQGMDLVTDYAKYLLEYLDNRLSA